MKSDLPRMTREEYLEFEERSEEKHEWHDGLVIPVHQEVVGMSGGTFEHAMLVHNVGGELRSRLGDGRCVSLGSEMKLWSAERRKHVYPDASAYCGEPEFEVVAEKKLALLNPTLVVEVLSASTENYDRGDKFALYRSIASFREYVLINQERARVETFFRTDDGNWKIETFDGLDAVVPLHSVGIELPLAEIYRNVRLPE